MSQHIQHHHQAQYVHYTGPPGVQLQPQQQIHTNVGIAPQDTTRQQHVQQQQHVHIQPQPQVYQQPPQQSIAPSTSAASGSGSATTGPIVATGDWTKDLVHLAKTAELKKHALTLQLHTAHILSAHASLEQKSKTIQDIKEQKNRLESERTKLLNALREINEDRDKVEIAEATMSREFVYSSSPISYHVANITLACRCEELRLKITQLTDGEYAIAKRDVDRLRQDLGQQPLPSLQSTMDEKSAQYLQARRLAGSTPDTSQFQSASAPNARRQTKRSAATGEGTSDDQDSQGASKRPRGRPKGSRNKKAG
ncbi:hypothetical protein BDQ12DRAFT_249866 [Crucibulum laeve]|uniref:Uncharacterized protein n=1 Tax=Crucibulum laeve TaxID=68775 RepID=A0A5C3LT79_9AGAR|nr:hypothetical protein BDQ12DRAFT_249866 [Crucibulum laeve]